MSASPIPQSWEARKGVTPDWAPQFDIYVKGEASRTAIVVGPHAEARARFIEAAPDLLEVLEAIAPLIGSVLGRLRYSIPSDADILPAIAAAIAKAKGEA